MKPFIFLTIAFLVTTIGFTQKPIQTVGTENLSKMPIYGKGEKDLAQYLLLNTKYPESAKNKKEEGDVYVSFIINNEGKVQDVKILKGISEDLNAEAIRVVQAMPRWQPGYNKNNEPVNVQYVLPIKFSLSNSQK